MLLQQVIKSVRKNCWSLKREGKIAVIAKFFGYLGKLVIIIQTFTNIFAVMTCRL